MQRHFSYFYKKIKPILYLVFIFFVYDVFIIKSPRLFLQNILGLRYFVNYIISLFALFFFILIIDNLYKRNLLWKIIAFGLLIIPLGIQTAHYCFYNMPLNAYGIRFFLHEPALTTKLGMENINYFKVILFLLFSFYIFRLFNKNSRIENKMQNLKIAFYLLIYVPIIILCGVNWYLILDYQNPLTSVYAVVPEVGRSFYFKQLKANKPQIVLQPTNKKMPNILWIIGESVTKDHMSLYGYKRKTTPHLDALHDSGELIAFQNVVSIGPHTIISVPYMMVGLQNIDPQGIIYSTPNIFEYAKARGYETAFISSQDLRWRNFDQLVGGNGVVDYFRSGPDFSANVSVAKGADDIKVLDTSILPHLSQIHRPFLLVAHMDGSHYPYSSHSEPAYKKFFPEDDPNSVNAYDNTLTYSDIYFAKLIAAARQKDPDIWIFYTTDHGQPVEVPLEYAATQMTTVSQNHHNGVKTPFSNSDLENKLPQPKSDKQTAENKEDKPATSPHVFTQWQKKITTFFTQNENQTQDKKIIFNQGYDKQIIHNAFFIVPPAKFKKLMESKINDPVAQSDIFATILELMDIQKPSTHIDGVSLLQPISPNRLRVSTGFVTTIDNVPEAQVTYPDYTSIFIDFSRQSVSLSDGKTVIPFAQAPKQIQDLFATIKH